MKKDKTKNLCLFTEKSPEMCRKADFCKNKPIGKLQFGKDGLYVRVYICRKHYNKIMETHLDKFKELENPHPRISNANTSSMRNIQSPS